MIRFILSLAALAILTGLATSSARASDYGRASYRAPLNYNTYRSTVQHNHAHPYPLTRAQEIRLHDNLNHQAVHNRPGYEAYDRGYHAGLRTGLSSPSNSGYGYRNNNNCAPNSGYGYSQTYFGSGALGLGIRW